MLLYFILALVGTLFLVVSVIFGEVLDVFDFDWDDGVHPLSGKVIAVGLTVFGATGMLARYYDWDAAMSAIAAGVAAALAGAVVWWMLSALYRGSASTDVSIASLVGRQAQVTVGISPSSVGEILVPAAGSTRHILARAKDGQAIAAGTTVRIVQSLGNVVLVERVEASPTPADEQPQQAQRG